MKKIYILSILLLLFLNKVTAQAPGTKDATFNPDDVVALVNNIFSQALQPDGKVIIGGDFTYINSGVSARNIARLNMDGTVDNTFNPGVGTNGIVSTILIQPDGKILIGGDFTSVNDISRPRIARLNTDGSLDNTFQSLSEGANNSVIALALQSDNKILIGGAFTMYDNASRNFIARLNSDGSLDAGFDPMASDVVRAIAVQPDGKILVGGDFTFFSETPANRITRLNSDGSVDGTFIGSGADNVIGNIVLQPDGKILIGGAFTRYDTRATKNITRSNADGTVDLTFVTVETNGFLTSIVLQPDNNIVIGGVFTEYNGASRNRIARLSNNGALDAAFAPGTGADNNVSSVVLQTDGKIIIAGAFLAYNTVERARNARINPDGTLDNTYRTLINGANNEVIAITRQSGGKILIGGSFTSYNGTTKVVIARINADGSLDSTFNTTGANGAVRAIAVQPDGKILVGGDFTTFNGLNNAFLVRLNADGSTDNTFFTSLNNTVSVIKVQSDGKMLIGGSFTLIDGNNIPNLARLNSTGTVDQTFTTDTGPNAFLTSIVVQPDGKILIGGAFTDFNGVSRNRIARLNNDGTLDISFNPGTGANDFVSAIALRGDGKIYISGNFTNYNGTNSGRIARLNADGSSDGTFNTGIIGFSGPVFALNLQVDGRILVGGAFTNYNGQNANRFTRMNECGCSLDETFNSNTGTSANNTVSALHLQPDGKILLGGIFTSFNNLAANRFTRINGDDIVLPIILQEFTARTQERKIMLRWSTGSEQNNSHFSVERSADGKLWDELAQVPGAGFSSKPIDYQFTDERPANGLNYYRLFQTDFNGTKTELGIQVAEVNLPSTIYLLNGYVNSLLEIYVPSEAPMTVLIVDMLGRIVLESTSTKINVASLLGGLYKATITQNGERVTKTFIKL